MARGWESKAVADQIEAAEERQTGENETRDDDSPEVRERSARLQSLKLSRSRTLAQLERATNPRYREMLLRALGAVETKIEELNTNLES